MMHYDTLYHPPPLQGKLLVAVNNKVMLYKMSTTADGRQELVSDCSPVGVQVLCLHLAVRCVCVCVDRWSACVHMHAD